MCWLRVQRGLQTSGGMKLFSMQVPFKLTWTKAVDAFSSPVWLLMWSVGLTGFADRERGWMFSDNSENVILPASTLTEKMCCIWNNNVLPFSFFVTFLLFFTSVTVEGSAFGFRPVCFSSCLVCDTIKASVIYSVSCSRDKSLTLHFIVYKYCDHHL